MLKFGFIALILAVGSLPSLIHAACDMMKCRPVSANPSDKSAYCPALKEHIACLATFENNNQCAMNQKMTKQGEKMASSSEYSFVCEDDGFGSKVEMGRSDDGMSDSGNDGSKHDTNPFGGLMGNNDPNCDIMKKCPPPTVAKGKTSEYCSALSEQVECTKGILQKCPGATLSQANTLGGMATAYKEYKCGAASLAASSLLCFLVSVVAMMFKR